MLKEYPRVHGEYETLAKIKEGFSISRLGDGELKVAEGNGYSREKPNPSLSKELRAIFNGRHAEHCLIGIPTMDPKGTKYRTPEPKTGKVNGWYRHKDRFCKHLNPEIEYYSALITRPDCGKWMMTAEYAEAMQSIWLGKSVAVIGSMEGGATNKMWKAVSFTQEAEFIECPYMGAYAVIDELEGKALACGKGLIIISAGVTATCLANRLSPRVQALDLGSIGGFLCKMLGAEKWDK